MSASGGERDAGVPALGPGAEFDLIRGFLARAASDAVRPDVRIGPGDDCAVVMGTGIAISTDLSIEGTHFRREWLSPEEIGFRAVAGALSDLAAVAARPIGVLVSVALTDADAEGAGAELMHGAVAAAESVGAVLLGGDVARTDGPLTIDAVVVGEAPEPVGRGGARPGDALWVTGRLGGAAAAVDAWRRGRRPEPAARAAFARPRPRTDEARWLAGRGLLRAAIDLSDGLAGDAGHLAAASGCAVVIDPEAVPVHPAARPGGDDGGTASPRLALTGGEDYELCFAATAGRVEAAADEFAERFGVPLTRVGEFRRGSGVHRAGADGPSEPLRLTGYRHFEGDGT